MSLLLLLLLLSNGTIPSVKYTRKTFTRKYYAELKLMFIDYNNWYLDKQISHNKQSNNIYSIYFQFLTYDRNQYIIKRGNYVYT